MSDIPGKPRRWSKYAINEEPLLLIPSIACAVGVDEAVFIQQVIYWLKKSNHEYDDRIWIYNKMPEWLKQMPFFKQRTLERIIQTLKQNGVLHVTDKYNHLPTDRTNWYAIDFELLDQLCDDWRDSHPDEGHRQNGGLDTAKMADSTPPKRRTQTAKMADSIYRTETTTETTKQEIASAAPTQAFGDVPAAEKPKRKEPKLDPNHAGHPLIQAYRALYEHYPKKGQFKIIIESNPPLDNWVRAMRFWLGKGRNPFDVVTQLDMAHNPNKMKEGGSGKQGNSIHAAPGEAIVHDEAEIARLRQQFGRDKSGKEGQDV